MKGAVAFRSPEELAVTLELPHRGKLTGMGTPVDTGSTGNFTYAFLQGYGFAWLLPCIIGFVAGTLILRFSGGEAYPMLQESEEQ